MPSRVGPRHAGQSFAGSIVRDAALAENAAAIPHHNTVSRQRMNCRLEGAALRENDFASGFTCAECPRSIPLSSDYLRAYLLFPRFPGRLRLHECAT